MKYSIFLFLFASPLLAASDLDTRAALALAVAVRAHNTTCECDVGKGCPCAKDGCSCQNCNCTKCPGKQAKVLSYNEAYNLALQENKQLVVYVRCPIKEIVGSIVCRTDTLFPELVSGVVTAKSQNGIMVEVNRIGTSISVPNTTPNFSTSGCASGH